MRDFTSLYRRLVPCAAFLPLLAASPLSVVHAQDTPPSGWGRGLDVNGPSASSTIQWLGAWSPLRPVTDVARGMLRAPFAPGLLDAPPPLIGAFVVSGAPGALAHDFRPALRGDTATFSELKVRYSTDGGEFRRPLDLGSSSVTQASAQGWSQVGPKVIIIGRAVIDREGATESSHSEILQPYRSTPFVDADSVTPPMSRARARFEGAVGVNLGSFGLGLSAGVESREHSTYDFPLRRGGRAATPALAGGVEHTLPWLNGRIGGYYRWTEPVETYLLNSNPLVTRLFTIQGYDEPNGVIVSGTPVMGRINRRATAVGGTLDITVGGSRLVVTHERGNRADDQNRSPTTPAPPVDRWRSSGSETRFALQRQMGERARATVVGSYESLEGTGTRYDLGGLAVEGTDSKFAAEADLRIALSASMSAAVSAGVNRIATERYDHVIARRATPETMIPFAAFELARMMGSASAAVGFSAAFTSPGGSLPNPTDFEENYKLLIAPALAYDVAEARALAGWISGSVPFRNRRLVASIRAEQATATSTSSVFLQPTGTRSGFSMTLGIR